MTRAKADGAGSDLCRVCGFCLGEPGWSSVGTPNYIVCACCGSEAGVHDASEREADRTRADWLRRGAPWLDESCRPTPWSAADQLARAGIEVGRRNLRG